MCFLLHFEPHRHKSTLSQFSQFVSGLRDMKERNKQVKGQQTLSFAPPKQVTLDVQDVEPQRKCFSHDAWCETMAMLVAFLHMCGNMSEGPCFHVIDGVSPALLIFAFEFVSLSGYWCPSSLDICLLFVPGMISHPTGSEDFGSHPFVSPIV